MNLPRLLGRVGACGVLVGLLAGAAAGTVPRTTELNLANQAQLEMVKGIGPQLSERILAERANGRFASWEAFIARMRGIGPRHASSLSEAGLRIEGHAYAGNAVEAPTGSK